MIESGEAFDFRLLYRLILDFKKDRLYQDVLFPLEDEVRSKISALSAFRRADGPAIEEDILREGLWSLYALSRINDYLLLPFQSDERGGWQGPAISRDQYLDFFTAAGFTPFVSDSFSPFRHEIVKVHPSEFEDEPIRVVTTLWPGLMFGEMLFSRSGVAVSGGISRVDRWVAEGSTLYFTHRRLHRRTDDLSKGWGSNSQWRTAFRRDYEYKDKWLYHSNGKSLLARNTKADGDQDGLTAEERIELCKNRCFIVTRKDDVDLWPYDDRYEEPITP
jgi:hypothetical protein